MLFGLTPFERPRTRSPSHPLCPVRPVSEHASQRYPLRKKKTAEVRVSLLPVPPSHPCSAGQASLSLVTAIQFLIQNCVAPPHGRPARVLLPCLEPHRPARSIIVLLHIAAHLLNSGLDSPPYPISDSSRNGLHLLHSCIFHLFRPPLSPADVAWWPRANCLQFSGRCCHRDSHIPAATRVRVRCASLACTKYLALQ